jgi:hypothetical protein
MSRDRALPALGGIYFVDESDDLYGVKHVGNKPRISCMPYT